MRLASRGLRDMTGTRETITDPEELRTVRRQALGVLLKSVAATAIVGIGVFFVDG